MKRMLVLGALFGSIVGAAGLILMPNSVTLFGKWRVDKPAFLISKSTSAAQVPERVKAAAITDDRGQYRLFDLAPGSYYLTGVY